MKSSNSESLLRQGGCLNWSLVLWNPDEGGSNSNEGMDVLARQGHVGKKQRLPYTSYVLM